MGIAIGVIVGVAVIVAFFIGFAVGSLQKITPIVGNNDNAGECKALCNQWEQRRTETCMAQRQADVLQAESDGYLKASLIALAVAVGLAAAALAASYIPYVGAYIAAGLFAAAITAFALAASFFGIVTGLSSKVNEAKRIANEAKTREDAARMLVIKGCSIEEANQCLNRPSPC